MLFNLTIAKDKINIIIIKSDTYIIPYTAYRPSIKLLISSNFLTFVY